MKFREIKSYSNSINVSSLGIGSSMRMNRLSKDEFYNLYDMFADEGGNCVDTTRAYSNGKSEESVGVWLKERKKRSKIIVSTKKCEPTEDIIESVNSIIKSVKVRMIGCSNRSINRIEKANTYAKEFGLHGFVAS